MQNGFPLCFLLAVFCLALLPRGAVCLPPKLLLISFDGFRHDLLNRTMTPNIYEWALQNTLFTNGSQSQYVSFTGPNHQSIITGLYEESHGIVSNYFYDTATNKSFDYFNSTGHGGVVNASLQPEWFRGEAIWVSNERGGNSRLSSTFFWPMGQAPYPSTPSRGRFHREWTSYGNLSSWMADCDNLIAEFTREKDPVNFVAWYIAEPDGTLHKNGFYNGALKAKVAELDQLFRYLLGKLSDRKLELNLILTADHGHSEIKDVEHVMCIRDFLPAGSFFVGDHMLYPRDEQHAQEIFDALTAAVKTHLFDVKVHLKRDFPAQFHYHNSSRIGAVILEPGLGSSISFSCTTEELEKEYGPRGQFKFNSSTHGMDPALSEMRALLVMGGPGIAKKTMIPEIPSNIDLYPFMCHLLDVTPAPNNGSLLLIRKALIVKSVGDEQDRRLNQNVVTDSLGFLVFFLPPFIVVLLYLAYGCRHTILKDDPSWALKTTGYRPLDSAADEEAPYQHHPPRDEAVSMSALLHGDDSSLESI